MTATERAVLEDLVKELRAVWNWLEDTRYPRRDMEEFVRLAKATSALLDDDVRRKPSAKEGAKR